MTYAYTTASMVKAELKATTDFSASTYPTADQVATWISEESDEINGFSDRNWGVTTYSDILDYQGEDKLLLENAPVISITSVLYSPYELGTTSYGLSDTKVAETDYTLYDDEGVVQLLPNWKPYVGRKRIKVNYTAGFNPIPAAIQKLATKKVAQRVISSVIQKDIAEKQSGKSVSVGSISIVKPADVGVSQYKELKNDIQQMQDDLINAVSAYRINTHRY